MLSPKSDLTIPDSIDHIGIVVRDVDATIKFLSSTLNLGPWKIIDFTQSESELMVGQSVRLKVAYGKLGTTVLELLEPLEGEGVWSQFLENGTEGLHHLAFSVMNWDGMVSEMRDTGAEMIAGGHFQGKRWCYFHTKPGGIVVELMDRFGVEI